MLYSVLAIKTTVKLPTVTSGRKLQYSSVLVTSMHIFLTKSSRYKNKIFVTENHSLHTFKYIHFSMTANNSSSRKYILVGEAWMTEVTHIIHINGLYFLEKVFEIHFIFILQVGVPIKELKFTIINVFNISDI